MDSLTRYRAHYEVRLNMPDKILAVIIPFFQLKAGILARALRSIRQQRIPEGWLIDVIVVDDGSPCSVDAETRNLSLDGPLRLRIIRQENRGVAAARNRALDEVDRDTGLIAFLDSDDIWPLTHLERAIGALGAGYDFCFRDSRRFGHYASYLRENAEDTTRYIVAADKEHGLSKIASDEFVGLMLKEFPAQVSTVVYKHSIAPDLRFDEKLNAAGEDLLFLCILVTMTRNVAFDHTSCVECGPGLNMYYNNLSWDNPKRLAICIDSLIAHKLIDKRIELSAENRKRNDAAIRYCNRQIALQIVRCVAKCPTSVPSAIIDLIKKDTLAALLLPLEIFMGGLARLKRNYVNVNH
jgi:succinoglycan biosynthesis protein ExoW